MSDRTGEKIQVNIDDDIRDAAIRMFVHQSLRKESISTYPDYNDDGCIPIDALAHAVINEMVIRGVEDKIRREEFAEELKKE